MKKLTKLKALILYLACSVPDIATSIPGAVAYLLWGERLRVRLDEYTWAVVFSLKEKSWPMRTWYAEWGGTCFGRMIMLSWGRGDHEKTIRHEMKHTEQYEVGCMFGAIMLGAAPALFPIIGYWFPFALWAISAPMFTACGFLCAWLRGENAYRGSVTEEAAYDAVARYEMERRGG